MNKATFRIIPFLLICLLCTGCGQKKLPTSTYDGQAWSADWTTLGSMIGVSVPEGFTQIRDEGILFNGQSHYYVWTKGQEYSYTPTTDTEAETEASEVKTYDVQIHLLAAERKNASLAADDIAHYQEIAEEHYSFTDSFDAEYNGQTYSIITYAVPDNGGPATTAASANALRGEWSIHVDVLALEGEDPLAALENFLSGCYFAK